MCLAIHQLYFEEFGSHINFASLKQVKLLNAQISMICEGDNKISQTLKQSSGQQLPLFLAQLPQHQLQLK